MTSLTDKPPLYIFFHINKCAGTTLRLALMDHFSEDELLILYNNEPPHFKKTYETVRDYLTSLPQENRDALKVIFGHRVYLNLRDLFPNREIRLVTVVREPVARMVSQYNWLRMRYSKEGITKNFPPDGNDKLTYEAWANYKNRSNFISRFLLDRFHLNADNIDADSLEQVKDILSRFYFVGILENGDDFLFVQQEFGIDKPMMVRNKSLNYYSSREVERIKAYTADYVQQDKIIYDYACQINRSFKDRYHEQFSSNVILAKKVYSPIKYLVAYLKEPIKNTFKFVYRLSAILKKHSEAYTRFVAYIKGY